MFNVFSRHSLENTHLMDLQAGKENVFHETPAETEDKRLDYLIRVLSAQKLNRERFCSLLLSELAKVFEVSMGVVYIPVNLDGTMVLKHIAGYAVRPEQTDVTIEFGQGFAGQAAADGKIMNISEVPASYLTIESGLGRSSTASLMIVPVMDGDRVAMLMELASFREFTDKDEKVFSMIAPAILEGMRKSSDLN